MDITSSVVNQRDKALVGGDYAAYHAQASRRLHAIRKRLGVATAKGRKYTPKTAVKAQDIAKNTEWVQLLLTASERAWASAMEMKSSQSPENTQKAMAGSTKRQIASRLRRAVIYARNLVELLRDQTTTHATSTDILEAQAYLHALQGGLALEKSQWEACVGHYSAARIVYAALGATSKSDVFKDQLANVIDPSIRYAAYQMRLPRTKPVTEIAIEYFPDSETETREMVQSVDASAFEVGSEGNATAIEGVKVAPSTISWRKRNVKIEDAAISQALGLAELREKDLSSKYQAYQQGEIEDKDVAAAYDDVINARQDAVDATKAAIDELTAEGIDPGDSRMQALQVTRTAVNYGVIEWRIGRNRILCGAQDGLEFHALPPKPSTKAAKESKPRAVKAESSGRQLSRLRERVALYESILQNLDVVHELPGVVADAELSQELDSKKNYFRALKCLAIGRSHSINNHALNALALYVRAADLAQAATTTTSSTPAQTIPTVQKLDVTQSQVTALTAHLANLVLKQRAMVDLHTATSTSHASASKAEYKAPMIERLHQFDENVDLTNLVTYPPKLQPIPVKPIFFDLAWNYIDYPGRRIEGDQESNVPVVNAAKGQTTTAEEKKEGKKGWFGFGR